MYFFVHHIKPLESNVKSKIMANVLVFLSLVWASGALFASSYSPTTSGTQIISGDSFGNQDILQIAPPSVAGISVNRFSTFEVTGKSLLIDNSIGDIVDGQSNLIVIIADDIVLNNKIEILGNVADLLLLSEDVNGTISCSNCELVNMYRATMAVTGTNAAFTNSPVSIGNLAVLNSGTITINSLNAPGILSLDVLATTINTSGNLYFHQKASELWEDGSYDISTNGNIVMGTSSVNFMNGRHSWNYENQRLNSYTNTSHQSSFAGNINAVGVRFSLASRANITARVNTEIDRLVAVRYNGIERVSGENIQVNNFYPSTLNLSNAKLTSEGDVSLNSVSHLTVGSSTDVNAKNISLIARYTVNNYGDLESDYLAIGANDIVNEGSILTSVKADLLAETSIFNQYGGEIEADKVFLKTKNNNGIIRNGSRTPYRSTYKSLLPIDGTLFSGSDHVKLGTYYTAGLDKVNTSSKQKPGKTTAHIRARYIDVKTDAFENINPYYEIVEDDGSVTLQRDLQMQVSAVAEASLRVEAEEYIVNSSAFMGVEKANGFVHLKSDVVTNERYRVLNILDITTIHETINPTNPYAPEVNIDSEIVRTTVGTFSPPGMLFSMGGFEMGGYSSTHGASLFLNSVGYFEVFGNAKFKTAQLVDAGLAHEHAVHQESVTTYWGTMCSPCYIPGQSSKITDPEQMDSLFYVNGDALASEADQSHFVDYRPFDGYLDIAVQAIIDTYEGRTLITNGGVNPNDVPRLESLGMIRDYTQTQSITPTIDKSKDKVTIDWWESQRYTDYFPYSPTHGDTVYKYASGSDEFSIFELLKDLYYELKDWFTSVLNEVKWW